MGNSQSKLAKEINDQYFTPPETAQWCFDAVGDLTESYEGLLEPLPTIILKRVV